MVGVLGRRLANGDRTLVLGQVQVGAVEVRFLAAGTQTLLDLSLEVRCQETLLLLNDSDRNRYYAVQVQRGADPQPGLG